MIFSILKGLSVKAAAYPQQLDEPTIHRCRVIMSAMADRIISAPEASWRDDNLPFILDEEYEKYFGKQERQGDILIDRMVEGSD